MGKFVARFASYLAFILLQISAGNVASRRLNYDDVTLVSDGVSDGGASTRMEESFLHLKGMDSYEEQCNHLYGFLPCSSNLLGHICLLIIYEFLLYHAESFAGGDGRIFRVFGKHFWVSSFSQLLDALPDSLILFVMGLSTNEEKAQEYVVTGAGMLAGSSILLLSFLWGICFVRSRKEFYVQPPANPTNIVTTPPTQLQATVSKVKTLVIRLLAGSGVVTDAETKYHANFLFYSLIPFIFILLPRLGGLSYSSQEYRFVLLVSLVVSVSCVITYFIYQISHPRIKERRLEYAEAEQKVEMNIPFYEVEALMLDRERQFMIKEKEMEIMLMVKSEKLIKDGLAKDELTSKKESTSKGKLIKEKLTKKEFYDIFKDWIDDTRRLMDDPSSSDKSGRVEYNQVLELLHENKKKFIDQIPVMLERVKKDRAQDGAQDGARDKSDIYSFFKSMDTNKDGYITSKELKNFIMKVNDKELRVDDEIAEIMMRYLDTDKSGNIDKLELITGVSELLVPRNLTQSQGSNQETQMMYRSDEAKAKRNEKIWAVIWLLAGICMLLGLAEPLVESVREVSKSLMIGPFYLWFILVPWATNIRTVFAAYRAAGQKRQRTISITFSEIYHKVFMNNIVGFFVIAAVIYFRGLTWHFSAELLVVIIVCIIMGLLGSFKTKFPNWTLLIVFPLYPLSLLAVYLANDAFQFT